MRHVKARVTARKIFAAIPMHFDAIVGDVLPLLSQNRDHINTSTSTQGKQEQFHWSGSAAPVRVGFNGLRVARRRDTHEEIVAREMDCGLAFVVRHRYSCSLR